MAQNTSGTQSSASFKQNKKQGQKKNYNRPPQPQKPAESVKTNYAKGKDSAISAGTSWIIQPISSRSLRERS